MRTRSPLGSVVSLIFCCGRAAATPIVVSAAIAIAGTNRCFKDGIKDLAWMDLAHRETWSTTRVRDKGLLSYSSLYRAWYPQERRDGGSALTLAKEQILR